MATIQNVIAASHTSLGGTTDTLAFSGAAQVGDILYGMVRMGTATSLNSVTDSVNGGGSPWTIIGPVDNVGRQYFVYFINSGAGTPTMTFTFGASGQAPRYAFGMIRGAGTGAIVGSNTNTNSSANLTAGAINTAGHANTIIVGGFSNSVAGTFTQNGSWTVDAVEPAAGTSRIAIVHQSFSSAGSYNAAIDQGASNAWVGIAVAFDVPSSGLNTGSQTASTGYRDVNATSKTTFNNSVAGFGMRDVNAASRTIGSDGGTSRTGYRANNIANLAGKTNLASLGFRANNVTSITSTNVNSASTGFRAANATSLTSTNINSGSFGPRAINAASKVTFNNSVAGVGFRAINTAALTSGPPTNNESFGMRAVNATTRTIGVGSHASSFGVRSNNQTTRAIAAGANAARLGLRSNNITGRTIASGASNARQGFRATNISFLGGPPPEPIVLIPNFAECETDLTLPASVVWSS